MQNKSYNISALLFDQCFVWVFFFYCLLTLNNSLGSSKLANNQIIENDIDINFIYIDIIDLVCWKLTSAWM